MSSITILTALINIYPRFKQFLINDAKIADKFISQLPDSATIFAIWYKKEIGSRITIFKKQQLPNELKESYPELQLCMDKAEPAVIDKFFRYIEYFYDLLCTKPKDK